MPHWKDFTAWVTIDGKEAPEYSVEISKDQRTVTCCIASELGKTFSIHWTNTSYYADTVGHVKVDGNPAGGIIIRGYDVPKTVGKTGISEGARVKNFVFSSLKVTEDDTLLSGPSPQELGIIQLIIYPIQVTQRDVPSTLSLSFSEAKVHERSKKAAIQHMTKLTKSEKLARPHILVSSRRTGPDLARFYFKYRPMDVLQANGSAPIPIQLAWNVPIDALRVPVENTEVIEELKMLRARLNVLEAKLVNKKKNSPLKYEANQIIDLTQETQSTVNSEAVNGREGKLVKKELKSGGKHGEDPSILIQYTRSTKVKIDTKSPGISGEIIDLT